MKILYLLVILFIPSIVCLAQTEETKAFKKVDWIYSEADFNTVIKEEKIQETAPKIKQPHISEVSRVAATEREELLIRKAEALYPKNSKTIIASTNKAADVENLDWVFSSFDGVKIANIVSTRAIRYYQEISQAFRNNKKVTEINMSQTHLSYTANISHRSSFEINDEKFNDVDVVNLSLSWSQYCGSLCAMGFGRRKLVIFKNDAPIEVFIDADLGYWVS